MQFGVFPTTQTKHTQDASKRPSLAEYASLGVQTGHLVHHLSCPNKPRYHCKIPFPPSPRFLALMINFWFQEKVFITNSSYTFLSCTLYHREESSLNCSQGFLTYDKKENDKVFRKELESRYTQGINLLLIWGILGEEGSFSSSLTLHFLLHPSSCNI